MDNGRGHCCQTLRMLPAKTEKIEFFRDQPFSDFFLSYEDNIGKPSEPFTFLFSRYVKVYDMIQTVTII